MGLQSMSLPAEPPNIDITAPANLKLAPSETNVSDNSIAEVLVSLTARYRFTESQAKEHLLVFLLCVFVLVAIIITSVWFPFYINPVLYLITMAVAWYGTTMLYVGFVYGNWEMNALTNTIEELELYRAALETGRRNPFGPR